MKFIAGWDHRPVSTLRICCSAPNPWVSGSLFQQVSRIGPGPKTGALVLDIAFAVPECHKKLLTVILPSVDVGQNDFQ